jgi:hypothetical protein
MEFSLNFLDNGVAIPVCLVCFNLSLGNGSYKGEFVFVA